jgi:hypothetical protein
MTTRRTFLAALAATAFAGPALLAADKEEPKKEGEWEKLGQKEAGRKEERDLIEVTSATRFTALSFKVDDGDLEIADIKVTFEDDTTFSPDTRLTFREGQRSGKIDLPGKSRSIKRVRFLYRSVGGKRAVLHLYGKIGTPEKK